MNPLWIKVALLAIATMIVEDRLALTPQGVLLHGAAIIFCLYLLLFKQLIAVFFIVACALLAATIIRITAEGQKLRSIGNWTFIPALILANELHTSASATALLEQAPVYLPYLLFALTPALGIAIFKQRRASQTQPMTHSQSIVWFSRLHDFGSKTPHVVTMAAMIVGVSLAALLVEHFQMQHGQWVIWGVASVVTGNTLDTARIKLRSRTIGVALGVPLGIALGQFVIPHSNNGVTLATMATFLTLVAFTAISSPIFFAVPLWR
jgi:hypothetical protein